MLTDAALQTVASKCTQLTQLSIPHCAGVTEAGLLHVAALPLTSLDLSWNEKLPVCERLCACACVCI